MRNENSLKKRRISNKWLALMVAAGYVVIGNSFIYFCGQNETLAKVLAVIFFPCFFPNTFIAVVVHDSLLWKLIVQSFILLIIGGMLYMILSLLRKEEKSSKNK
jgi:hypothetical protein